MSILEYFPAETVKYWMLLSRFLVGVGSGMCESNGQYNSYLLMMSICSKHNIMSIISF